MKYFLFLILTISCSLVRASQCLDLGPLTQKEFNETRLIFNALITNIEYDSLNHERIFYLKVYNVFKGDIDTGDLKIYTSGQLQASDLEIGFKMLLFLNLNKNKPFISRCSRQYLLNDFSNETSNLELKKYLLKKNKFDSEFYFNDTLRSKGQLKNGLPDGKWYYYREDGTLKMEGYYENGFRVGLWKDYYNGAWHHQYYINGIKNGIHTEFFENGLIKETGIYVNDCKTGVWTSFYSNGTSKEQIDWTTGYIYFWNSWDPKGEIMINMGNGIHRYFDDDGNPESYSNSIIENGNFK